MRCIDLDTFMRGAFDVKNAYGVANRLASYLTTFPRVDILIDN